MTLGQESRSIYNKESLAAVWDLTRALEQLEIVDEVQSLATMKRLESVDGFLEVANLMPARELTPEELAGVKRYVEENPNISGMLVSPSGDFTMLAVVPTTSTTDAELAQRVLETNAALAYGIGSYVSGMPYIRGVLAEVVRSDVLSLMRIGLLVLVLILLINLRSPAALLMVLAVIVLSTLAMMGFFGWLFNLTGNEWFNFTMLNTTMPVILLTIATADGVHIMTRFFREVRVRQDAKSAVRVGHHGCAQAAGIPYLHHDDGRLYGAGSCGGLGAGGYLSGWR